MTNRQKWLLMGCQALGIDIEFDVVVSLIGGQTINTVACIPSLGGTDGMLIVRSFEEFRHICNDFPVEQYGVSVLGEPSDSAEFNLDACREMFIDWGWNGDVSKTKNTSRWKNTSL